jgi:hypothetical protein
LHSTARQRRHLCHDGIDSFPRPHNRSSLPIKAGRSPADCPDPVYWSFPTRSLQRHPSPCLPSVLFVRPGAGRLPPAGRGPANCSPASLDTGPVASAVQTDHSLLQPDILTASFCPHSFDLVAGVTNKSRMSLSHLRLTSFVFVQRLQ